VVPGAQLRTYERHDIMWQCRVWVWYGWWLGMVNIDHLLLLALHHMAVQCIVLRQKGRKKGKEEATQNNKKLETTPRHPVFAK
jgi:hypothetical protein